MEDSSCGVASGNLLVAFTMTSQSKTKAESDRKALINLLIWRLLLLLANGMKELAGRCV